MFKLNRSLGIVVALLTLCAGAAYAKASDPNGKTYEFKQEMEGEIGGKILKPGVYTVAINYANPESGRVTIFKNKEKIVEVPCKVEKSDLTLESNSVAYDRNSQGQRVVRWFFVRNRHEKVIVAPEQP